MVHHHGYPGSLLTMRTDWIVLELLQLDKVNSSALVWLWVCSHVYVCACVCFVCVCVSLRHSCVGVLQFCAIGLTAVYDWCCQDSYHYVYYSSVPMLSLEGKQKLEIQGWHHQHGTHRTLTHQRDSEILMSVFRFACWPIFSSSCQSLS